MSDSSFQERTEEATPKRRQESIRKGQVPRSRDLGAFLMMCFGIGYLVVFGDLVAADLFGVVRRYLLIASDVGARGGTIEEAVANGFADFIGCIAPLLALMVFVAGVSTVMVGGWNFTTEALGWKSERLSVQKGVARMFSVRSMLEMLKSLAKVGVVGVVGVVSFSVVGDDLILLGRAPVQVAVERGLEIVLGVSVVLLGPLALIAAIDVPIQISQNLRQLRMTKQEVKDEMKGTEGRPEVKGRIRRLQQELATRRMMDAVRDADVIVNNPTHYSVAIKYDEENMRAPVVVGLGKDLVAHRIRATAVEVGIAQVQWPLLARALYSNVKLGGEIPVNLYIAVAKVLSYVFALGKRDGDRRHGSGWNSSDIPEGMVKDWDS